jgi:hypothetical protein
VEDNPMAIESRENQGLGQLQEDTDYASNSASGAKPAFALSAWSLVLVGIFLALMVSGLLLI